ncbi:PadR family transcriptional regulator [Microbacterium sp. CH-015]|uniref:PadR family transcriptional regulator n=1 Tax=Microbacterium sp. CH-015 TaxID=3406734 RepID=UPI003C750A84
MSPENRPSSGRLAHGELRVLLLRALEQEPQHGYDLMRHLGEQVGGGYRPSPGAIYPRLSLLASEGLVEKARSGRQIVYTLTSHGRAALRLSPAAERRTKTEEDLVSACTVRDALHGFTQAVEAMLDQRSREAGTLRSSVAREMNRELARAERVITTLLTAAPATPGAPRGESSQ